MTGKRLALVALMVAVVAAVPGGLAASTEQPPPEGAPGQTYGGLKDKDPAWLRLDPSRRSIAAMEIHWGVDPKRCSNRKGHLSTLYAGYEHFNIIRVNQEDRFSKTIVDRYTDQGSRYVEHQVVRGAIRDNGASGSISGRVRIVKPGGQVVRCTFGPQGWRLVN